MKIFSDMVIKNKCFYGVYKPEKFLNILLSDGTSAVVFYRMQQFFHKINLSLISMIFIDMNKLFNGCVIGLKAEFGAGFVIMHPYGVVINSEVKGGENIVIESGVVIGAACNGVPVEAPVLGNNIFIGSGAKILGGIKIGDNAKIGANAVVLEDVPDGATVVGIPARVVKRG
jgi:serine O-acetyltransferase